MLSGSAEALLALITLFFTEFFWRSLPHRPFAKLQPLVCKTLGPVALAWDPGSSRQ